MIHQLKHDISYVFYNRKYRLLILLTILLTAGLTIYTAVNTSIGEDILIQVFGSFRQMYWILCAYLIADLLSTDYHSKTFKNIIPKLPSRNHYYLSKIIVATLAGIFFLLIHVVVSWLTIGSIAAGIELNYFNISYFLFGAVLSLLFYSSMLAFIIAVSGKETVTIGVALGLILLQALMEGLDPVISAHFPTMYVSTLHDLVSSNLLTGIISISCYLIFTFLLFIGTIKIFSKQDLFT